jgi:predicted DCC family thiol-disulfide oxidoreductase YuxK
MSTLVFDGDCGFCTSSARWLEQNLPHPPAVVAWQLVDLDALGLQEQECSRAVQWVGADGVRASGARAIGRLLIDQGPPWAWAGLLTQVPPTSWVAAGVYSVIARNRYRLPGGTPACRVTT